MVNFITSKPIYFNILYALAVTTIFMFADKTFSLSNEYFIFEFTLKEFFYKLFLLFMLISTIPKPRIRLTIFAVMLLFSFIQYIHFQYFGKNINAIEFYLFFSNINETFEALNNIIDIIYIPFAIIVSTAILVFLIEKWLKERLFSFRYGLSIFLVGIFFLNLQLFYITNMNSANLKQKDSKLLYPNTNRHSTRNFFVSLNYFLFGILPQKLFDNNISFPTLEKPKLISSDINRTVVFIIGESLRFDKFVLANNKLTPRLQTLKGDKLFFKKVYSGGTMTKVSVSVLINRLKYPRGLIQVNKEDNCLFKLAKESSFDTYFISAQTTSQLKMIKDMICPKYIDKFISRDDFTNYIKPSGYDIDLQTVLDKIDVLSGGKSLIVLHQRGSHTPYQNQYPKEFDLFLPYDNTVLYTDYSLYKIIKYLENRVKNELFIIYVSDHGELLGENGKHGHGELAKEVYEVPFLLYTNSKDSKIKESFENIKSHYDISNFIISLLGYEVEKDSNGSREIYILNADLDGFSGCGVVKIEDGVEKKIEIKKF
jgi:glucan phosphoethanolaminetransferase (alkaline phosphatase superfamily)